MATAGLFGGARGCEWQPHAHRKCGGGVAGGVGSGQVGQTLSHHTKEAHFAKANQPRRHQQASQASRATRRSACRRCHREMRLAWEMGAGVGRIVGDAFWEG